MNRFPPRPRPVPALLGFLLAALATFAAPNPPPQPAPEPAPPSGPVVALGRLRPQGGLIRVAAPFSFQGPAIISELRARVGQRVQAGEILGRTHVHPTATAAVSLADAEVAVRQARLALVESGLKPAEIAALAAEAERDRADLSEASLLLTRAQRLRLDNSISAQELESAQARWHAASNRVLAASQRLAAGAEVREVDLALARAEVEAARALAHRARREQEQTEIRAPLAGEVLAILARPGETATAGLVDLGNTDTMEVLAEVYESDLRRIRPGQSAEVRGDAFPETAGARVVEIGRQIRPNRLLNPDPAAFADNRVVEVILELQPSPSLSGLSGALVRVRFLP